MPLDMKGVQVRAVDAEVGWERSCGRPWKIHSTSISMLRNLFTFYVLLHRLALSQKHFS